MQSSAVILWHGVPSALDVVEYPMLSLEAADHPQDEVRLVMSDWRGGVQLRRFSIEFEKPIALLAVEEMFYSIATAEDARAEGYLRETESSALLDRYGPISRDVGIGSLRHFLVTGLNMCVEVVASRLPAIHGGDVQEAAR